MNRSAPPTLPSPSVWLGGWLVAAEKCPSPNFGPRPLGVLVDLIVLHSISLPPGQYGTGCVQQLFSNTLDWSAHPYFQSIQGLEVSSHFFIERTGRLWQFVSCDDRAWHAGHSCFEGRDNCNDFSIGIELEGLEGEPFTPAQYTRLAHTCLQIEQAYPVRFITGHEDIAKGRKFDPGAGFHWQGLARDLERFASNLAISHCDLTV